MPVVTLTKTLSNMWSADLESVNKTHMRKNKALVEETQIIFLIEQKHICKCATYLHLTQIILP